MISTNIPAYLMFPELSTRNQKRGGKRIKPGRTTRKSRKPEKGRQQHPEGNTTWRCSTVPERRVGQVVFGKWKIKALMVRRACGCGGIQDSRRRKRQLLRKGGSEGRKTCSCSLPLSLDGAEGLNNRFDPLCAVRTTYAQNGGERSHCPSKRWV